MWQPIARHSARDLVARSLIPVIAGQDAADPSASLANVPDYEATLDGNLTGLRIAVPRAFHDATAGSRGELPGSLEASIEGAACARSTDY